MYSPIKADRWSCGHVLQHFLDKLQKWDELFIAIAEQLKAQDPNERPSLLELHNWSAATRSLGVANARTAKQRERKGSRPLEAPIRETVALPGAKRQRRAVLDGKAGGSKFPGIEPRPIFMT